MELGSSIVASEGSFAIVGLDDVVMHHHVQPGQPCNLVILGVGVVLQGIDLVNSFNNLH